MRPERAWFVGLPALLAVLLSACSKHEQNPAPPSVPPPAITNMVAPVQPPPEIPMLAESVATIQGSDEIPVKAPRSGYLVRQVYMEGADVKAGDVLFLLDARNSHADSADGKADNGGLIEVLAAKAGVPERALRGAGDRVQAGEPLAMLAEVDRVVAELTLPDALARNFSTFFNVATRAASPTLRNIELILPDGTLYPDKGIIVAVIMSGKTNTMRIDFSNPDHVLRPGEFVKVRSAPN
jgi:multidrug efflux pump subunit AcrA (membrane-fusion protein)